MKPGSLIMFSFLVIGMWYAIGYIQGEDAGYARGLRDGEKEDNVSERDD